jgi:hypothetical protein
MRDFNFSDLIGLTLKDVVVKGDVIYFLTDSSRVFKMYHEQDCCENVGVEDIAGDIKDLIGLPLLVAEESSNHEEVVNSVDGGCTWTFYKLATFNGHVVIRWLGESNGYYSESVDFVELSIADILKKVNV